MVDRLDFDNYEEFLEINDECKQEFIECVLEASEDIVIYHYDDEFTAQLVVELDGILEKYEVDYELNMCAGVLIRPRECQNP